MDHPFARVPYEDFRRAFRTGQKHVEREFAEMKKALSNGADLDTLIEKVRELETKLSTLYTTCTEPTLSTLHARIAHLHAGGASETQLTRWLVDWALREGKPKTAAALVGLATPSTSPSDSSSSSSPFLPSPLAPLVDIPLFTLISSIITSLRSHDCAPALAFAKKHRLPTLEFELRLQEFIELCRGQQKQGRIEKAMTLVAFPPTAAARIPAYRNLYAPQRWAQLETQFRLSVYDMYGLPHEPVLWLAMYAGLVALKHPVVERNVDCPVCPPTTSSLGTLDTLAQQVPSSHHPHSVIVCRISGKITHEPMAFPNGFVYGREALEEMYLKGGCDKVRCPRSGMECSWTELRKVFIS
ncbi:hypothetical protein BDZ89DRAFT_1056595 [Hymenopellis radicata]|nr:hypothetical protein BDZ89DRAFT_1056595 [Hymenopellis radicata]